MGGQAGGGWAGGAGARSGSPCQRRRRHRIDFWRAIPSGAGSQRGRNRHKEGLTGVKVLDAHALGGGHVNAVVAVHKGKAAWHKEVLGAAVEVDHVHNTGAELGQHRGGALLHTEAAGAAGEGHAGDLGAADEGAGRHGKVEPELGRLDGGGLGLGKHAAGGAEGTAEHAVHGCERLRGVPAGPVARHSAPCPLGRLASRLRRDRRANPRRRPAALPANAPLIVAAPARLRAAERVRTGEGPQAAAAGSRRGGRVWARGVDVAVAGSGEGSTANCRHVPMLHCRP